MIGRLLCWLGLHVPPRGINPAEGIWSCHRCHLVQLGDVARRR